MDIKLEANLILMADTGNLEGLGFFFDNSKRDIESALCIEALQQGRLSTPFLGMRRGEIICELVEDYNFSWLKHDKLDRVSQSQFT